MATIRYFVRDLDRAVAFYTTHLGFKEVEKWGPAFAIVERDGLQVWLSGPGTSAAKPMPDGRKPEPGGWNRFVIAIENLPERVEAMRAAGVTFRNEVVTGPGGRQILAEDPDGNPIELFEPA